MHTTGPQGRRGFQHTNNCEYDPDSAHTVEVQREVNDRGELGSFGFTLLYERPPIVGTIVPGEYSCRGRKQVMCPSRIWSDNIMKGILYPVCVINRRCYVSTWCQLYSFCCALFLFLDMKIYVCYHILVFTII